MNTLLNMSRILQVQFMNENYNHSRTQISSKDIRAKEITRKPGYESYKPLEPKLTRLFLWLTQPNTLIKEKRVHDRAPVYMQDMFNNGIFHHTGGKINRVLYPETRITTTEMSELLDFEE